MSKLLIVESPAKAKTISKYLGGEYVVRASIGHIRDLPKSNKKAIDIEAGFVPNYEIVRGKEKVVADLETEAKKADEIMLATDPDREGEAIAWHIAELLKSHGAKGKGKGKKIKRITYHEITEEAIEEALKNPRDIDENLRRAQEARRVLDRLVGYDLSGLIWKKVRYGLSAGRVQSPALRILMEREREIRAFTPITYWTITVNTKTAAGAPLSLICEKEPTEKTEMERIVESAKRGSWRVESVEETETRRSPRAPFTTSTLQQSASSRLGFSPSRTMSLAQRLYEAGHITYMRTDSTNLAKSAVTEIASVIEKTFGKNYLEPRVYTAKSKNAQEAHEAIRPTHASVKSAGATDEQRRLYKLIFGRTLGSQMSDAKLMHTKIVANVEKTENNSETESPIPTFSATGSRTIFDGWLKADPDSRGDDVELPPVEVGQKLGPVAVETEEKQTQPPSRYTEAGLIKELEKRGIGRPSTYASIMRTLEERGYTEKQGRTLFPTDTGDVVSEFLEKNFGTYISDTFTAEMEDKLDDIASGTREYAKTLGDFYKPFHTEVKEKEKLKKATTLGVADPAMKCPLCDSGMVIKLGRSGKFLSCSRFPECTGGRTIDGTELEGPKETGEMCPDCKEGKLVERDGKFGRFVACARYPKCKFVKRDENAPQNSSGVKCPVCKEGEMVEKRGRFGTFWSCSNYPKCKNAIKAKPTGTLCPMCQSLMMEGTKTIPERCSNKICPNHNPHKLKEIKLEARPPSDTA